MVACVDETRAGHRLASINNTFARLLRRSGSRSTFARQAEAADVTLTQPSYVLLRIMIDGDRVTMGQLAKQAHMDLGMATRQVDRLVKDGLVTREADPSDRRVTRVTATPTGMRLAQAIQDVRMHHLRRSLAGWSEHDLSTFDTLLTRFLADTETTPFGPAERDG